ncbi:DUF4123 domain-containing protein [Marinobacter zhejiangensis]|uniref:DUF4123 domain-containing protein n=1 Tax=Marinobacter zhejiangensis TaxID=488535 RepID=UPI00158775ED|nr:DUF4123 domain-containing protein [Marinobacter zhejiangensis]
MEQAGEGASLYLVLSGTSEGEPVRHFYEQDGLIARPLFLGTAYSGWHEVMPYLAQIDPMSGFLDWIEETEWGDWGWAAVSMLSFDDLFGHLQSLIKIRMPDQREVFFRYWDARFFGPLLSYLDDQSLAAMMGPVKVAIMPGGQPYQHSGLLPVEKQEPSPWFQLTPEVERQLSGLCWHQLVDATLAELHRINGSPLLSWPPEVARLKVERQLRRLSRGQPITELSQPDLAHLHQCLLQEARKASPIRSSTV